MALNLNKEGEEDKSSAPQPEKKSLNLSKEETKPVSKMNLSKDSNEPASKLNLSKEPIVPAKDNVTSEKKQVNLSKKESKPVSKLNLSKDPIEPLKDNVTSEKKESNLNTNTSKGTDNQPKKKSKTLFYSILGIVSIALVVFLFNNNKKGATGTSVSETTVSETPVAETTVSETPVAETSVTETPVAETTVSETPVAETTVSETPVEQFESGTSIVNSPNDQQIKLIKDYLAKNASNKITLIGYASSEGDINFNKSLSEKRAQSMKDYLSSNGVEVAKILIEGAGIENPIGDNNTESGRKQNRRVEVKYK